VELHLGVPTRKAASLHQTLECLIPFVLATLLFHHPVYFPLHAGFHCVVEGLHAAVWATVVEGPPVLFTDYLVALIAADGSATL
jgi:hypothetical protein